MGKFALQAGVMLGRGREPDAIVLRPLLSVPEDENDLVLHVDRETTKHRARRGRQWRNGVEDKFVRDRCAPLGDEGNVIDSGAMSATFGLLPGHDRLQ